MNFGDSTEPEWDGATADSGSQCAETHEIADSGEKHPVCAPIANFPPPGKIPFESRIKRMIYCSLLQYWIDCRGDIVDFSMPYSLLSRLPRFFPISATQVGFPSFE
jgi:hypothetical protein